MTTELTRKRLIADKEINEIKRLVRKRFPDAVFRLTEGAEPSSRTLWLNVYTDLGDPLEISDLVIDRKVDLLVRKKFLLAILPQPLAYVSPLRRNGKTQRAARYAPARGARTLTHAARERQVKYQTKSKKRGGA